MEEKLSTALSIANDHIYVANKIERFLKALERELITASAVDLVAKHGDLKRTTVREAIEAFVFVTLEPGTTRLRETAAGSQAMAEQMIAEQREREEYMQHGNGPPVAIRLTACSIRALAELGHWFVQGLSPIYNRIPTDQIVLCGFWSSSRPVGFSKRRQG